MRWTEFFGWFLFWVAVLVAVWVPNFLTKLANFLGIGRGADLVFYLGLLALFFLIFHLYVRLEKIEKNITKIVQADALDNDK